MAGVNLPYVNAWVLRFQINTADTSATYQVSVQDVGISPNPVIINKASCKIQSHCEKYRYQLYASVIMSLFPEQVVYCFLIAALIHRCGDGRLYIVFIIFHSYLGPFQI